MGTGPVVGGQGRRSVQVGPRSEPASSLASCLIIPHTADPNSSPYSEATEMQGKRASPSVPFGMSAKVPVTSTHP